MVHSGGQLECERSAGVVVGLTYDAAREVLRASGDQRWLGSRFGDPHDWRRAVLGVLSMRAADVFGLLVLARASTWFRWVVAAVLALGVLSTCRELHVLVRARRAVPRVEEGIAGRYVLARNPYDPCLVLFPPRGEPDRDEAPWGAVKVADSRGGVPLAGDLVLMGQRDASTGLPQVGSIVVPVLPTGPLWPTSALRQVQFEEGQLLEAGRLNGGTLRPASRTLDRAGGAEPAAGRDRAAGTEPVNDAPRVSMASEDAHPTAGPAARASGPWARALAVGADILRALDLEAAHAAAGWIGVLLGLVLTASIVSMLVVPDPLFAAWIALVVALFALRAVAQTATGASPGQRARGLRVVAADGGEASLCASALRNTVAAVLTLSVVGIPLLLLPVVRRDRRGVHDLLAGTRVIRVTTRPDARLALDLRP